MSEQKGVAEFNMEKGISSIVGVFTDALIVYPGGWEDTIPGWLKEAVTLERLIECMKYSKGAEPTATDAEVCIYLYTASLCFPFDHDWTQIYLHIAGKVYSHNRTKESGVEVPDDIKVESLNRDQERDLAGLRSWIYNQRTKRREEKDRGVRREEREEKKEEKRRAQPALFEF